MEYFHLILSHRWPCRRPWLLSQQWFEILHGSKVTNVGNGSNKSALNLTQQSKKTNFVRAVNDFTSVYCDYNKFPCIKLYMDPMHKISLQTGKYCSWEIYLHCTVLFGQTWLIMLPLTKQHSCCSSFKYSPSFKMANHWIRLKTQNIHPHILENMLENYVFYFVWLKLMES